MDVMAIQAAISSLKAATDISKSIMDVKTVSEVQSKVIELQGALLEAQNAALSATASQFELQEKIRKLEAELKERGDWAKEKSRYQLVSPWRGPAQAYALKKSHSEGEQPHLLCPSCFQRETKEILCPQNKQGWAQMVCPKCTSTMDTGYWRIGAPVYAENYAKES